MQKTIQKPMLLLLLFPLLPLLFGIYHGLMQALYRAGWLEEDGFLGIDYYQGLTGHGVFNAIVLTTFFAVAFGHSIMGLVLKKELPSRWVWVSTMLMVLGSGMTAVAIFQGKSSVLYTFYPPLKAEPTFYLGLVLAVVGSWVAFWTWLPAYGAWRKENPDKKTPMAVVGILATFLIWQLCTLPVAYEILVLLLPWSLGWVDTVNVLLARTLFWFFGHALVYFWLLPAYTAYYAMLPKLAGGKLYSDFAGRFVFLSFCVLSVPLGLHHQFADPGIQEKWKAVHTVLTAMVSLPSVMTAFTLAASLEFAARMRGGTGLFRWWGKLPHFEREKWLFPYLFCGLLIFILGGATGIVNASYNVNSVVHNTAWVPAHFHFTVGGPVFLAILGVSLLLLGIWTQREILWKRAAVAVPWGWLVGVMLMSLGMFITGLQGAPRRTNLGMGMDMAEWMLGSVMTVIGGVIMTAIMGVYFAIVGRQLWAWWKGQKAEVEFPVAEPLHDEKVGWVQNFRPWVIAAVLLTVVAYTPAIIQIVSDSGDPSPRFAPNQPGIAP
ncbi:MAG: cbb3-type cytochrome c oxidase subunit I [Verrucomicrobiota bacterium]